MSLPLLRFEASDHLASNPASLDPENSVAFSRIAAAPSPYLVLPKPENPPFLLPLPSTLWSEHKRFLKIGIAWSGNKAHVRDKFRSVELGLLKPLLRLKGCIFYSLQLEQFPTEFADCLVDLSRSQRDLADTAQIVQQLDLVISVDTAIAHLAGALAKPVWVLLSFWPDWRWGLDRPDTPWYPTMRLFRQQQPGQWHTVVESVQVELQRLTGETEHTP